MSGAGGSAPGDREHHSGQYAAGYRLSDNYDERVRQIELITQVLRQVGAGSRLAVVGLAMKLARGPALRAGWGELYDFLARGHAAFKQLRDLPSFVGTIGKRERRILDQLFAGDLEPFTVLVGRSFHPRPGTIVAILTLCYVYIKGRWQELLPVPP